MACSGCESSSDDWVGGHTFIIGSGCVNPNEREVPYLGDSEWGAVCAPVDQGRFRRSPPALPPRIRLRKNWVYPRQSSLSVQCNEEW
eukprot:scaffold16570_cov173-Isochrysis_galbana.AAC.1